MERPHRTTILLCDDDQETLDATSATLSRAGYTVLQAHGHEEVHAQLRRHHPDLIILDVRMPDRDGFWIAESLQVLGCTAPVIFITAYDRIVYRLYAPFVGSKEFLIKPVSPSVLLDKVEDVLRKEHKVRT